jgi:quercetin dioxygenase-like cupin family protein
MGIFFPLSTLSVALLLGVTGNVCAQAFKDVQPSSAPLILKAQGSFFVGGRKVEQSQGELGNLGPGGHIVVDQMYVHYMVPQAGDGIPVVMVHGATLTGKTWETTPDGRMGWDEYFVRKGHPVYVPDQVGRGRSGFNQAIYNNVRGGAAPPANQPELLRFSDEGVWPNFRFGPKAGLAFEDSQFPIAAVDELAKQAVPDTNRGLPTPTPTIKALSELAGQLNGAVLMGHSQSGYFPLAAALLDPKVTKALVLVEPGTCPVTYTDEQIKTLTTVPVLVVFGDHRDNPTGLPTLPTWQARFEECRKLIGRLTAAGGKAYMMDPTERGIRGNSHMMMQDRNSFQIADLIIQWLNEAVSKQVVEQKTSVAPAPTGNFTGSATVASRFTGTGGSRLGGATVIFQPGARTRWHIHPLGQVLVVTEGKGWVQMQGEAARSVKAGDVVWTAPGVKHWHGATAASAMTHVAVVETQPGAEVTWLEPLSDEQYRQLGTN